MSDATSALFFSRPKVGSVGPSFFFFFNLWSLSGHTSLACVGTFIISECKEPSFDQLWNQSQMAKHEQSPQAGCLVCYRRPPFWRSVLLTEIGIIFSFLKISSSHKPICIFPLHQQILVNKPQLSWTFALLFLLELHSASQVLIAVTSLSSEMTWKYSEVQSVVRRIGCIIYNLISFLGVVTGTAMTSSFNQLIIPANGLIWKW